MLHTFHIFAVLFFDCSRKALAFAEEFDVDFVSGEPQKPEHKPELLQLSWRAVHNKHTIITILTTNWIEAFPHIYKYPANEKMLKHAQFFSFIVWNYQDHCFGFFKTTQMLSATLLSDAFVSLFTFFITWAVPSIYFYFFSVYCGNVIAFEK